MTQNGPAEAFLKEAREIVINWRMNLTGSITEEEASSLIDLIATLLADEYRHGFRDGKVSYV